MLLSKHAGAFFLPLLLVGLIIGQSQSLCAQEIIDRSDIAEDIEEQYSNIDPELWLLGADDHRGVVAQNRGEWFAGVPSVQELLDEAAALLCRLSGGNWDDYLKVCNPSTLDEIECRDTGGTWNRETLNCDYP